MLERIIRQLESHSSVHDWQVELNHKRGHQLFLVGERVETERTVETVRAEVRIFNDHAAPGGQTVRGEASFVLLPQDGDSAIAQKLQDAVFMAGLVGNPLFSLPGPADYPQVEVLDQRLVQEPRVVLDELSEQLIASVSREPQVRLSSSECFLDVGDS
ncbi:MAG TPA: hypothetical protein VM537_31400, partial [Anaerolineae bacterium]|nr:hypothetical protein [Anaerolineae bacterium]